MYADAAQPGMILFRWRLFILAPCSASPVMSGQHRRVPTRDAVALLNWQGTVAGHAGGVWILFS